MKPLVGRWALAITTVCAAAACGDREIAGPIATTERPALALGESSSDVVAILKRTRDVHRAETATGVIGPKGGHLQLDHAGLRIEFAPGAVKVPTRITITAAPGRDVAYEFEPHGLVFSAPVTLVQDLRHTIAWKNPSLAAQLEGSYFDQLFVDPSHTYAKRRERRAARLRDNDHVLEFRIEHFSGYMISTGKSGVEVEVEVEVRIR